ncbi:hypothetical protein J2129_000429 [Methanofollis sp. W23]|uniref:hypothetical protein n=1 Tax=Methanofollis sp. W23 TaxID=2817849 RepID=UPI001AE6EA5B|nr:hypothetical protein [Methanofollis sp. W23]MBP2144975.1 hypothetical protein [Methanofollis sp. W23]
MDNGLPGSPGSGEISGGSSVFTSMGGGEERHEPKKGFLSLVGRGRRSRIHDFLALQNLFFFHHHTLSLAHAGGVSRDPLDDDRDGKAGKKILKGEMLSVASLRAGGSGGGMPRPRQRDSSRGFLQSRKDALQFEKMFTPREFWNMLMANPCRFLKA